MNNKFFPPALAFASGKLRREVPHEGIRIFYYHGVVERKSDETLERNMHLISDFRNQIKFLQRANVLSLDELKNKLTAKSKLPGVVITVDDGYRNNLILAEIMASYKLPWVLFASTGAIGNDRAIWTVELSLLLLHGNANQIQVCEKAWSLATTQDRESSFHSIRAKMKTMPSSMVCATMDHIRSQFPLDEASRLLAQFPSLQMLSWDELGQLAGAGVEIGSHGVDHHLHHTNQPAALRLEEMQSSKAQLSEKLEKRCRAFSFPNGDYTSHSTDEIAATGYEFGFTTQPTTVQQNANPYLLPRLLAPLSPYELAYRFYWSAR